MLKTMLKNYVFLPRSPKPCLFAGPGQGGGWFRERVHKVGCRAAIAHFGAGCSASLSTCKSYTNILSIPSSVASLDSANLQQCNFAVFVR